MENLWNNEYRIDERSKRFRHKTENSFQSKILSFQKYNKNNNSGRHQQKLSFLSRKAERHLLMINSNQKISKNDNAEVAYQIRKNEPFLSKSFYLTKFRGFRDLKISKVNTV